MFPSSDKKLEMLNDHYKDTFSHLVAYRKQRDRLLLYLLGLVTMLVLYQLFPREITDGILKIVSKKIGVDIILDPLQRTLLVYMPPLLFCFILAHRYWQIWNLIDSQYDYLEELETELASLFASGIPFTRESNFSHKNQNVSIWSHEFYNWCFRVIFSIILPFLGWTFGLRHYGFNWKWLVFLIVLIIFYGHLKRVLKKNMGTNPFKMKL